jgi:hypothetical protein
VPQVLDAKEGLPLPEYDKLRLCAHRNELSLAIKKTPQDR